MKIKSDRRLIKLLLGIFIVLFLTSCHSKYINLGIRTDGTIAWNNDSTAFAFIARTRLYRKPEGITKFPDGGIPKNEYRDFSIFLFDVKHKKLKHLVNLNEFYISSAYRWLSMSQISLELRDSLLFYKLKKPYKHNIKYIDEKTNPNFLENISKTYAVNIYTCEKSVIDTNKYQHLFKSKRETLHPNIRKKYLSDIPYKDWGINIKKLYPQSKNTYMEYIIEGKGAIDIIFEQIVPEFTVEDKKYIIDEMIKKQKTLLKDWNKLDREKDPYRRSKRKDKYINYIKYTEDIKKKFKIPSVIDKLAEQKKVLRNLQNHNIIIPNSLKFKDLFVYDQGYDVTFELTDTDSVSIEKYKKWFQNMVAHLLNNKWELDKQTKFEKPDTNGIVITDLINFMWEHTTLKYADEKNKHYLELGVNYSKNEDKHKFFKFSVSEEYIYKFNN